MADEFNFGLGYAIYLNTDAENTSGIMYNLGFKVGYDFWDPKSIDETQDQGLKITFVWL